MQGETFEILSGVNLFCHTQLFNWLSYCVETNDHDLILARNIFGVTLIAANSYILICLNQLHL